MASAEVILPVSFRNALPVPVEVSAETIRELAGAGLGVEIRVVQRPTHREIEVIATDHRMPQTDSVVRSGAPTLPLRGPIG